MPPPRVPASTSDTKVACLATAELGPLHLITGGEAENLQGLASNFLQGAAPITLLSRTKCLWDPRRARLGFYQIW